MNPWLLAFRSANWLENRGVWQQPSSADQQHQMVMILFFATSLILLIWLISRIQSRMRVPQKPHRPYSLFRRLLKLHGVGTTDRMLLLMLAASQRLKQPTLLLLSPALFARHAEEWLNGSAFASIWPNARQRLVRVAQQVFAEDAGQKA